jgi:magnesium transporter
VYAGGKLFLTHVDADRSGLLRRVKLGFMNRLLFGKKESPDLVPWQYVHIPTGIGRLSGELRLNIQREKLKDIHPVDLADIIEELGQEERIHIFDSLDTEKAADTLEEIEPRVQRELISQIRHDRIKEVFNSMTPVQIADLFSILPTEKSNRFIESLDPDTAKLVRSILDQREEGISTLVSRTYLAFSGDLTVADAFKHFRKEARDMDVIMYIYVTGDGNHLDGVIDIRELLQAEPEQLLREIMVKNVIAIEPGDTREDVEEMFKRYQFRAIPVVDAQDRIGGVIRYKDIFIND